MKKLFAILISAFQLFSFSAFATSVYFPVLQMTGSTNDVTINVRAVNNPVIWNGAFHYLPANGTNFTTSGGYATNSFVPGRYTMSVIGLAQSWTIYVTNSATIQSAVDLTVGTGIVKYSGIQSLSATGLQLTNDGYGNFFLVNTNPGSAGEATNVFFLDSPTITWSTTSSSNVAKLSSNVTNDWRNYTLAASNSITAAMTNQNTGTSNGLFAHIVAATNGLGGSGVDSATVVAIMATNNAATATWATNLLPNYPASLDWTNCFFVYGGYTNALGGFWYYRSANNTYTNPVLSGIAAQFYFDSELHNTQQLMWTNSVLNDPPGGSVIAATDYPILGQLNGGAPSYVVGNGLVAYWSTPSNALVQFNGRLVGDANVRQLNYGTNVAFFGDSIVSGFKTDTVSQDYELKSFANLVAESAGWIITTNHSAGGWITPTSQDRIFSTIVQTNNNFIYAHGSGEQSLLPHPYQITNNFASLHMAEILWLAVPDSVKVRATNNNVVASANWWTNSYFSFGKYSTNLNSTLTWTNIHGTSFVLGYTCKDATNAPGAAGSFIITVDGVTNGGTFSSKYLHTWSNNVTVPTSWNNIANAVVVSGLSNVPHTVTVTVTSADHPTNVVAIDYLAPLDAAQYMTGPNVFVGNVIHRAVAGHSSYVTNASFQVTPDQRIERINNVIRQNCERAARLGLNVLGIDSCSAVTLYDTHLQADGIHPSIAGHYAIAQRWLPMMNAMITPQDRQRAREMDPVFNTVAAITVAATTVSASQTNVMSRDGSSINAVGLTNGNVTIPGTLNVSGTTTAGTIAVGGSVIGNGSGITNLPVSALTTNGGTPGQVVTAQANGTVTWSNAPAGGSSVTFDTTQFGSAAGGTNIKSGALLTNVINRIDDETIFLKDSVGQSLMSWDTDTSYINIHEGLSAVEFLGNGLLVTNLNAENIVYYTNAIADMSVIDMTKPYAAISTNNNFVISGLSGLVAAGNQVQWATRFYTNTSGSTKTITVPAGWVDIGNNGTTIYNTNQGVLSVTRYPGFGTNFVWRGK